MKVSLNWVKEFTEVDLSTEELIALATERLGGVEGFDELGKHYEGIVVAKVVSCEKHLDADKLHICKVDDGGATKDVERDANGNVQVVCGAPNVKEGLLVAWIPPSSVVPASYAEKELFVLEARDLRGQISNGMLASPRELGLSDDHDGILEISEDAAPGTPFKQLYGLDDVLIDFENKMFTHRPDCFGQLGIAREIAGIQHKSFTSPDWYTASQVKTQRSEAIKGFGVTVEDPELCPRYMAVAIDGIKIGPSPQWLQAQLKRVGLRPINNVVDITNYMMVLTAQPLHAFDFDKIAKDGNAQITVRRPQQAEKITLLDGKTIEPHVDATLICSEDGPIALGGVMGGANSEVDENTSRILLECATFDMYNIRKTSMEHGIFSDAVTRFNKGQPAAQLPTVLAKAVQMFEELTGAHAAGEVVDTNPNPDANETASLSLSLVNDRLGKDFTVEEVSELLTNVEFGVVAKGDELTIAAPFWRTDIEIAEDVIEEVGRLYGFNNLPTGLPQRTIAPVTPDASRELKQQVRSILASAGANEVLTYSFVHGNLLKKVGQNPEDSYALRNALSPDLQYYRQTLTPNLTDLVHANQKAGFDEFALFEIGKTHNKQHGDGEDGLPGELNMIALTYASGDSKHAAYYSARRYLDFLASKLGFTLEYSPVPTGTDFPVTKPFDLSRSALVTIKEADVFLGIVGEYAPSVCKNFKLPAASAGFEIGTDHMLEAMSKVESSTYKPLSRYPSSTQDLTLQVADDTAYGAVEIVLKAALSSTDYQWTLAPLSIYKPEAQNIKNISFRITLSHMDRTLTTNEVSDMVATLVKAAKEAVKAEQV